MYLINSIIIKNLHYIYVCAYLQENTTCLHVKMASVKNVNMQFKNKKLILARNRVFGTTMYSTD